MLCYHIDAIYGKQGDIIKLLFASDIHGSAYFCQKLIESIYIENPDKIILLGDILYHGPRNDLPKDYNPKEVISMLNDLSNNIICVKGNCDAEVDQMVLDFTLNENYIVLSADELNLFITHGHKFNTENPPPMNKNDILIHGHTHISVCKEFGDGNLYLNPGSVSIPKEETENGYLIYENYKFIWKNFNNQLINIFEV